MNKEELEQELLNVDNKLKQYTDVLKEIEALKKQKKQIKKSLEFLKPITEDAYIISEEEIEGIDNITELIEENISYFSDSVSDMFYGEDIDDDGVEIDAVVIIGSKLYTFDLSFGAEWIGDWSMRCNVIDTSEYEIKNIRFIENFTKISEETEVGSLVTIEYYR